MWIKFWKKKHFIYCKVSDIIKEIWKKSTVACIGWLEILDASLECPPGAVSCPSIPASAEGMGAYTILES